MNQRMSATQFTFPSDREIVMERVFDVLPDVKPYNTYAVTELHPVSGGTKVTLASSASHDEEWMRMCSQGWTTTFGQLPKA